MGVNIDRPDRLPPAINTDAVYCMAYDIEAEFKGDYMCSVGALMLCVSMTLSCGYTRVVSRGKSCKAEEFKYIEVADNTGMSMTVITLMIQHAPTFIVGHNVYIFDNILLDMAIPKDHYMRAFFTPVADSFGAGSSSIGYSLDIPGINNLDTLRYVRKSMAATFQQFSLSHLCNQLDL